MSYAPPRLPSQVVRFDAQGMSQGYGARSYLTCCRASPLIRWHARAARPRQKNHRRHAHNMASVLAFCQHKSKGKHGVKSCIATFEDWTHHVNRLSQPVRSVQRNRDGARDTCCARLAPTVFRHRGPGAKTSWSVKTKACSFVACNRAVPAVRQWQRNRADLAG
jgi:hypothetical protein